MDETERQSALCAQLVKLIIQQGTIFSNWVKFVITVQGGLVAGLAFVLRYVPDYRVVLGPIIALFGVATALLFAGILRRHAQWSVWYLRRPAVSEIFPTPTKSDEIGELNLGPIAKWVCGRVPFLSKLFPSDGEIGKLPLGPVARFVVDFLLSVAITWMFVVIALIVIFVVVLSWRVPSSYAE
jgi:hypothetical protein